MASNNFLVFDENKQNVMTDANYATNTQRLNGVQSGVASSALQNKTLLQTSLMSASLAQIMNEKGIDSLDSDTLSAFSVKLKSALNPAKETPFYVTDESNNIKVKIVRVTSGDTESFFVEYQNLRHLGSATFSVPVSIFENVTPNVLQTPVFPLKTVGLDAIDQSTYRYLLQCAWNAELAVYTGLYGVEKHTLERAIGILNSDEQGNVSLTLEIEVPTEISESNHSWVSFTQPFIITKTDGTASVQRISTWSSEAAAT